MIMPRGEPLLLPVNPVFVVASLVAGLAGNMLPLGRVVWMPDLLMLLLVFWGVHQPLRVGMGAAFLLGLCMDVNQSALLGQHALSYTLLSFGAIAMHRRLLWFSVPLQALQVFPLFALAHTGELLLRMAGGGIFPGLAGFLAPVLETLLWPLASWVLLAPQRRPPDSDQSRPL
ncbi:rod shape-determining protein MreD [Verminephrobacter aporrectodeae subsp. tuberculatae]|uniref:Rod shape-determining protein MreD n=1 Tax=Verminephrobacter aporrectodeae subsp. tuberculatae TaxID=1110392 RepID=A0ABT3KTZ4_9BURK|nr:rod shape-determining protein MreD [Verminephrobacter aporrectodeae]MCW5257456.1 rod shape-determining protein MreD [Verminephrobacter aporrectodeae subsp. tuberculatae]MCW5321364.1 rod shape-determining protein MreD [Verminephrobacter aporrectodeae subsp. tuberculatae]MCW8199041.1 rod shape-determining protein MreD [Verminephrobacter aporrectodeae subsp. tuberculatae]